MGGQEAFFGVNFADGRIKGYPKSGNPKRREFYARYVRGNAYYGRNDFHEASENTIEDKATGLTWMRFDSGYPQFKRLLSSYEHKDGSLNWEEALDFCSKLDYAGHHDWRLPNAKELHSIVDYTRSPDTTYSAAISPIFYVTSITAPNGAKDYPYYWSSTTHLDGPMKSTYAVYIAFGRALGYMNTDIGPGR